MLQVKVLNPKARKILDELASLKLIKISAEEELFPLTSQQKKSIEISRKELKKGLYKENKQVLSSLRSWVKRK
ncbi:MAG: hypothetical protein HRU69_06485 [Flammeovirgaceae bacterium]|nr:MAG: hypothetical protein HRU69_06485 [Flammeovirgaceae bacterium]